jgi:hypothetical protein
MCVLGLLEDIVSDAERLGEGLAVYLIELGCVLEGAGETAMQNEEWDGWCVWLCYGLDRKVFER